MGRGPMRAMPGGPASSVDLINEDLGSARRNARAWWTTKHLLPYLWPKGRTGLKARVVISMVTLLLGQIVIAGQPLLFGHWIDIINKHGNKAASIAALALFWLIGYNVARFVGQSIQGMRDAIFVKVGQNAQRAIAVEVFEHLHQLSLRFHLTRQTGGLARLIVRGTNAIEQYLRFILFIIVPTMIQIALICAVFTSLYGWRYTGVLLVMMVVYVAFSVRVTEWRNKFYRETVRTDAIAGSRSIDSLLNFETVKYFNNEEWETERFGTAAQNYADAMCKSTVSLAILNIGQALIISLGFGTLMVMSQFDVLAAIMTVGTLTAIAQYLMQLQQPLNMVGFMYRQLTQSLADMERMFGLQEIAQEIVDKPDAKELEVTQGRIQFENVCFAYDPEREILKNLSFSIEPGQTVAVVGPSGAGKSTLARLLFRFYDVTEGRVLIDGQDVRDVQQKSLRDKIGIVPQDTVLFNETVRYNIAYGRPDATEEEIEQAARIAQVHDFIMAQPRGYDTEVGERGLKISGGEKQRVAIARTVLKAPPILILDEATTALDTHTEMAIQSALDAVAKGRTSLVIAHRLSTVIGADQILVMDDGRIVERGNHAELLAKNGLYASLWKRQREIDEAHKRLEEMEAAPEPHLGHSRTHENEKV
jgi:ABC-type transport system involved in Fe-S cluster assembly fused permease/ATPase subunit